MGFSFFSGHEYCHTAVVFPVELKPQNSPSLDWELLMKGLFQQIGDSDWVMYKSRWGAFYHTDLHDF